MLTADFDFELPSELIAQHPEPERAHARMMVVHRQDERIEHRRVLDLPDYLRAGDALVINDTRVIPARLFGRKEATGGKVEILLIEEGAPGLWEVLYRASGRATPGTRLTFADGAIRGVVREADQGRVRLELNSDRPLLEVLDQKGLPPLPPYIHRKDGDTDTAAGAGRDQGRDQLDRERYQTVYARNPGAVAAPTAGLHFTPELLARLESLGIAIARVTLHVGLGTFKPVAVERIEDHVMHSERYVLPEEAVAKIVTTRLAGGRVAAVGTTSTRVLESAADATGALTPGQGRTSIFIHPPYRFRVVDCLLTNFHLPRSTLLMLVSAFASRELILRAYREAVDERYRFYSYGDCMLLL